MRDDPPSAHEMLHAICREYASWPGLRLTAGQARRLWGLDPDRCVQVMDLLVAQGILEVDREGRYRLAHRAGAQAC